MTGSHLQWGRSMACSCNRVRCCPDDTALCSSRGGSWGIQGIGIHSRTNIRVFLCSGRAPGASCMSPGLTEKYRQCFQKWHLSQRLGSRMDLSRTPVKHHNKEFENILNLRFWRQLIWRLLSFGTWLRVVRNMYMYVCMYVCIYIKVKVKVFRYKPEVALGVPRG